MLITNKREFLARRLGDLGVVALLERFARRPSLLVATYHRIGDPSANPYYHGVYSASPESFRAQVRHLRDRFHLIGLDDVLALADSGFAVAEPTALITFDDGYRDNLDVASPILQELGVRATFFIPTGFFQAPRLTWWDHAAFVIKRSEQARITLDSPEPLAVELSQGPRTDAIMAVIRLYLDGKVIDEPGFRAHLEERAGVSVDDEAQGRALFMGWDGVRRLVEAGMDIGSHAHDHRKLSDLSDDDQRRELAESKRILEHETGREIATLAYPFGWPGTYDERTIQLARDAGYRVAFSSKEGVNRPGETRPFELRRLNIGFYDSPPLLRARMALQSSLGRSFL